MLCIIYDYICRYCGKECKNANSLRNHERLCKENPNHQISNFVAYNKQCTEGLRNVWNKGLTKSTCESIRKQAENAINDYKTGKRRKTFLGCKHNKETRERISMKSKLNHDIGIGHTWKHRKNFPSKAEQWLYNLLSKHNISFEREVPFYGFFLDVKIGDDICIEMDGEQHYDPIKFPEVYDRDIRKDKLLLENNWKELRVRQNEVKQNEYKYEQIILDFIYKFYKS